MTLTNDEDGREIMPEDVLGTKEKELQDRILHQLLFFQIKTLLF